MTDQRATVQLQHVIHYMTLLILMTSVKVTRGANCHNRLDIVFAVDTTSSESSSSFDQVKSEVKSIVSGFTVGQHKTRLALISMSKDAKVMVNFNGVNSLSDFNTAVDNLKFSTDVVDLSEGMKLAKKSVLNTARTTKISKILILVKDRRSGDALVSDASILSRMTSETAGVKSTGAVINVVGIGGLWNRLELQALFGNDYILFSNKNTALSSIKSLKNKICTADCSNKLLQEKSGLCHKKTSHSIKVTQIAVKHSYGLMKCEKHIVREFSGCSREESCVKTDRKVGTCNAGKVRIESMWQMFDYSKQSCISFKDVQSVKCEDAHKCPGQVADVYFLLDKSGSMGRHFVKVKQAAKTIIESLNIGPNNVRVGLLRYDSRMHMDIRLGSKVHKKDVIHAVDNLPTSAYSFTHTHTALKVAREELTGRLGRKSVAKFVFLITDGSSTFPQSTFSEAAATKSASITMYAIGIANANKRELDTITAPESKTNLVIMRNFRTLQVWARKFSIQSCIKLSAPHPKLCDKKVLIRSVSDCIGGKQQMTQTKYKYDPRMKCLKSILTTVHNNCKHKCVDPIDGNEHLEGERWTNICHDFVCTKATPLVPKETKCLAADGSCKGVGSPAFKCKDENGVEKNNCQCVTIGRSTALVINIG